MKSAYPCIYVDYTNNVWKFFKNSRKELCYKIMYGEGKWTKENIIDKNVLEFAIYINEDENIHIVYNNNKRELKYCTMQDKKWVGSVICKIEENEFSLENLKMIIINGEMDIFYILRDSRGNDHGILKHCCWNGRQIKNITIRDIILAHNIKDYYDLCLDNDYNINLFFINDEGDEISLNYTCYQNEKWTSSKRLYGIEGENIEFDVLNSEDKFHILNKSKDGLMYYLEHVTIDMDGDIQEFNVNESNIDLINSILFEEDEKIYCCYVEDNKLYYLIFDDNKWSSKNLANIDNNDKIKCYNSFIWSEEESSIKEVIIYGTDEPDLKLFVPKNLVLNQEDFLIQSDSVDNHTDRTTIKNLKLELSRNKTENKKLQKKIDYLNLQIQKQQKTIQEYEERLTGIIEEKHKLDENYNAFLEIQQNIQNDLNKAKEEANLAVKYKIEIENFKKELDENKTIIKNLNNSVDLIKNELLKEKASKLEVETLLNQINQENLSVKKQLENLNIENKELNKQLELEKNQSIMDRLLRKRSSEI